MVRRDEPVEGEVSPADTEITDRRVAVEQAVAGEADAGSPGGPPADLALRVRRALLGCLGPISGRP